MRYALPLLGLRIETRYTFVVLARARDCVCDVGAAVKEVGVAGRKGAE
jgi:hypothetical protein